MPKNASLGNSGRKSQDLDASDTDRSSVTGVDRNRFFHKLQEAAFGVTLGPNTTEVQLQATRELSALAERVSQLQVTDDERNAAVRRLCNLIRSAVKLLDGEQEAAIRWLKTPNVNLNGNVPVEMAIRSEDEADEVVQLIGRIQYGVFA